MCRKISSWGLIALVVGLSENRMSAAGAAISLSAASGAPGANITLTVTLATNGTQPAAVQWDMMYTSTDLSPVSGTYYTTGAAASAAGKSVSCNTVFPGDVRCIVAGINNTAMGNGALATVSFQISASTKSSSSQITFQALTATDASANPISISGTGATITINQPGGGGGNPPSLSSVNCSPAAFSPPGTASCSVTLSGAATSTTIIGLSSNSASLTVPPSASIASGLSSANFTATASSAVGSNTQVTITATLSSVTKSTAVELTTGAVGGQPTVASLACVPLSITGGNASSCTVTLSAAAGGGGLVVVLTSDNPSVSVPASITIPGGSTSGGFSAAASASAQSGSANISASAGSGVVQTVKLTVSPGQNGSATLVCTPLAIVTPGTSSCVLSLANAAPSSGLTVNLSSSSANLSVPATINVSGSATSAIFTATAKAVSSDVSAMLSASPVGASTTLTLLPAQQTNLTLTTMSCSPQTLTGGGASSCQLTISGAAPSTGLNVQLSSSSTQISVPGFVQVASGNTTSSFTAATNLIDHDENVSFIANLGKSSVEAPLNLVGIKPTALSCSPASVQSGAVVNCQITLNSAQATGTISVGLSSSNAHLTVPASVTSVAGQSTIAFQATTTLVMSDQGITVTAAFHGVSLQSSVTLTPQGPKITAPNRQAGLPGKSITFTVTATDPAGLPVTLSVYGLPPNSNFSPSTGAFSWLPQTPDIGPHVVHFTATNSASVSTTQSVVVDVGSTTPVILSLNNAASYATGGCSPGAAATLIGEGFTTSAPKAVEISPLPTQVDGLSVKINGESLPVYYASAEQVNFQCPTVAPGQPLSISIESGTGTSPATQSTMLYAQPGIFSLDGSGQGQGAILIANSANLAMTHVAGIPSEPAAPGHSISIYATGLGPVDFDVPVGQPAPVNRLVHVLGPVDVMIGGVSADVTFAGLAPGFTGLYQVNAKVPPATAADGAVSVQIVTHLPDGTTAESNVVTIAVGAN